MFATGRISNRACFTIMNPASSAAVSDTAYIVRGNPVILLIKHSNKAQLVRLLVWWHSSKGKLVDVDFEVVVRDIYFVRFDVAARRGVERLPGL
jgi:hypothetical protein